MKWGSLVAVGSTIIACAAQPVAPPADGTLRPPSPPAGPEPSAGSEPKARALDCYGDPLWTAGPAERCSETCQAETRIVSYCRDDDQRVETRVAAPCECGSQALPREVASCGYAQISLRPREELPPSEARPAPVDGCKLELSCAVGKLTIECDGEQDGTGTSLCDCYLDGRAVRTTGSAWPGEGAASCHAAAPTCLAAALKTQAP